MRMLILGRRLMCVHAQQGAACCNRAPEQRTSPNRCMQSCKFKQGQSRPAGPPAVIKLLSCSRSSTMLQQYTQQLRTQLHVLCRRPSAALAAEMQLVRSWREQRHAAACTIQAAVRSWLICRKAQHCRKVRQLQLCKARHILTAWRSEVEHRRAIGGSIVQQLEANSSRGCQLWQRVQLD
jgi:hypothetical protein